MTSFALWVLAGYFCGSVPWAWLIAQAQGVDIRKVGSGNVGATNVGRALGRKWGGLCLVLDVAKGLIPVLAAGWAMGLLGRWDPPVQQSCQWLAVGVAAILGHVFPVWLGFRGGKGVATSLGALLGFWPLVTLPALAAAPIWLIVAGMFRYVSLASLVAALSLPVAMLVAAAMRGRHPGPIAPFLLTAVLMAALVVVRHISNIRRLLAGTESRLGEGVRKAGKP